MSTTTLSDYEKTLQEIDAREPYQPGYEPKPPKGATQPPSWLKRHWMFIWPIPVLMAIFGVLWYFGSYVTLPHPYSSPFEGGRTLVLIGLEILAFAIGLLMVRSRLNKRDENHHQPEDHTEKEGPAS